MNPDEPGWFYVGHGQLQYKDVNGWTDQYQDIDGPAKTSDVDSTTSPDVLGPAIGKAGRGARGPSPFARFCSSAAHSLITGLRLGMAGIWHLLVKLWRVIPGLNRRLVSLVRGLSSGLRVVITGLWRFLGSLYRHAVGLWQRLIPRLSRLLAAGRRRASAYVSTISAARRKRHPSTSSISVKRPLGLLKRSWGEEPVDEVDRHPSRFRLHGKGEEPPELFLNPERLQDLYRPASAVDQVAGVDEKVPTQAEGTGA